MKPLGPDSVVLTDGFFKEVVGRNAEVSLMNIYRRFLPTRFAALDCVKRDPPSHIFFDSDVAKWLESAAYLSVRYPSEAIAKIVGETVGKIVAHQLPCGYFNSYYQVYKPDRIFCERTEHELYCAGHLIEAAVALDGTGLNKELLPAMRKYADYIYERFYVKRDAAFVTCGHPEIELALIRLYEHTKEEKYLRLAKFFLDERGTRAEEIYPGREPQYDQTHLPVREQREAVGHAVRAIYLYIAMADAGRLTHDDALIDAAKTLFHSIVDQKMYITGGTGSNYVGEWFTEPYDLPNEYAYAETCSAIALALFCGRLSKIENRAEYHEVFERVLCNNILAGQSLSGKGFFYTNPLETNLPHLKFAHEHAVPYQPIAERVELFDCSCCPPNLTRFFGQLETALYGEEEGALLVNQYLSSKVSIADMVLSLQSEYPLGGHVRIDAEGTGTLKLRIPAWSGKPTCTVNGKPYPIRPRGKYFTVKIEGKTEIALDLDPRLRFVYANERVTENSGRRAIEYGPLVLCAEGVDNGSALRNLSVTSLRGERGTEGGIPYFLLPAERLTTDGALYSRKKPKKVPCTVKLIPYYAWANRGETDMQIWFLA